MYNCLFVKYVTGGLTVDRWYRQVNLMVAVVLIMYTAVGVGVGYVQNITLLYIVFFLQGSTETLLQTGKTAL